MERPTGIPRVFVIGGNGKGIPVYRKLQRAGIPFAAGVIHQNDTDYEVAKALAVSVVSEKPFSPVSAESYEKAKQLMSCCEKVICCIDVFGPGNFKNHDLLAEAEKLGIIVEKIKILSQKIWRQTINSENKIIIYGS